MTIITTLKAAAIGACLAAIAAPAIAADQDAIAVNANRVTQSRAVSFADLDLSATRGRQTLERRIKVAANDVCDVFDVSLVRDHTGFAQCARNARETARAQVAARLARNDMRAVSVVAG